MDGLRIWNAVNKTDPNSTKKVNNGGHKFTSVDAYSQILAATKQFGPMGEGWGLRDLKWTTHSLQDGTFILQATAQFWWTTTSGGKDCDWGEAQNFYPVTDAVKMGYQTSGNNGYFKTDDEAPKKALTGCITKGLSYLGFNADVFLGMFDDDKYIEQRKREVADEQAGQNADRVKALTDDLRACTTKDEVKALAPEISKLDEQSKNTLRPIYQEALKGAA